MQMREWDAARVAEERNDLSDQSLLEFAHDLRTPLGSMQNAVDVISMDSGISEQSSDMLVILKRQLHRLAIMINKFSDRAILTHSEDSLEDEPQEASPQTVEATTTQDVLVVDDTRASAYVLQTLLKMLAQNVRSAENATDAMVAIKERMPNLVLSDLGMSGIDGFGLAKMIRSLPQGHSTRLVAVTGANDPDSRKKAIESGFDDFIVKPISYAVLVGLLNK